MRETDRCRKEADERRHRYCTKVRMKAMERVSMKISSERIVLSKYSACELDKDVVVLQQPTAEEENLLTAQLAAHFSVGNMSLPVLNTVINHYSCIQGGVTCHKTTGGLSVTPLPVDVPLEPSNRYCSVHTALRVGSAACRRRFFRYHISIAHIGAIVLSSVQRAAFHSFVNCKQTLRLSHSASNARSTLHTLQTQTA